MEYGGRRKDGEFELSLAVTNLAESETIVRVVPALRPMAAPTT